MDVNNLMESITKTIRTNTFGELKIRRASLNSLIYFEEELKKLGDDKEIVSRLIHYLIVKPKPCYRDFERIPEDELLAIARIFIKLQPEAFTNFRETTDEEFFKNFRAAFQLQYEKGLEDVKKALMRAMEATKTYLESFNKQYSNIMQQAVGPTMIFSEAIKGANAISRQLGSMQLSFVEAAKSVAAQVQSIAQAAAEALKPQIDIWQKWAEQNQAVFRKYQDYWKEFHDKYKVSEPEALKILKKYKWFVGPSMPINIVFHIVSIGRKRGNRRGEINRLFVGYFIDNECKELEDIINGWNKNELFKPRMKILRDCLNTLKNAKRGSNPSNVVLPVLIAQIDGIQQGFMEKNGLSFDLKNRIWKDASGQKVDWKKWYKDFTLNDNFMAAANDIFLNILFQKTNRGQSTMFTFNRHKIMHGECTNYGRIDNTVRAFMILDFLASLK